MMENLIPTLFMALVALIAGLMFLEGFYREKLNLRWSRVIDLDKILFPGLKNKGLAIIADKLAFLICVFTAIFVTALGILISTDFWKLKEPINWMAAFLFLGMIASWFARYSIIFFYKDKPLSKVPRIWPFRRAAG